MVKYECATQNFNIDGDFLMSAKQIISIVAVIIMLYLFIVVFLSIRKKNKDTVADKDSLEEELSSFFQNETQGSSKEKVNESEGEIISQSRLNSIEKEVKIIDSEKEVSLESELEKDSIVEDFTEINYGQNSTQNDFSSKISDAVNESEIIPDSSKSIMEIAPRGEDSYFVDDEKNSKLGGTVTDCKKEGFFEHYFDDNKDLLKSCGTYLNDLKNGLWKEYDKDRVLIFEGEYEDGEICGLVKLFFKNGKVKETGHVKNSLKIGSWSRNYINGKIKYLENFNNGHLLGNWQGFYENESIMLQGNYSKNKKNGLWSGYYNNGQLMYEQNYVGGVKHGKGSYYIYEFSSSVKEEIIYENDKRIGSATFYVLNKDTNHYEKSDAQFNSERKYKYFEEMIKNGSLEIFPQFESYTYDHNVFNGKGSITYTDSSKEIFYYKNGVLDGNAFSNNADGTKEKFIYQNGLKEGVAEIIGKNQEIETFHYENNVKEGCGEILFKNGNVLLFNYVDGKKSGPATLRLKNGDIEEFNLENNLKEGLGKYTYTDKSYEVFTYKNDIKEGKAKYFFINGDRQEYIYINGVRNGSAVSTTSNGEIITFKYINGTPENSFLKEFPNGEKIQYSLKNSKVHGIVKKIHIDGSYEELIYEDGIVKENLVCNKN